MSGSPVTVSLTRIDGGTIVGGGVVGGGVVGGGVVGGGVVGPNGMAKKVEMRGI